MAHFWCSRVPITVALWFAAVAPLVACSSAPTEPTGGSPAVTPPATSAPLAEGERVRAFIEARYPSAAVRHSFRTTLGQTVDCVDFFQMPGVRAMAARGEPITEMPKPPGAQPARVSEGTDEDGHERLCPEGTVLQIRVTPDDVAREGGLDAYERVRRKHAPARVPQASTAGVGTQTAGGPPPTMWPCVSGEFHEYAHVIGDIVDQTPGVGFGMDTMAVYAPPLPNVGGTHTVGQVWMFGGTIAQDLSTDPGCDPSSMDCVQSVEIGWVENPGDPSAHVFIFSTVNGYTEPNAGCYNGDGSAGCPPFIFSGNYPSSVAPNAVIPVSPPPATPPQELSALIIEIGGNYWVQIGVGAQSYYIGYYPGSNFHGPLSTFQVGGEVANGQNDFTNPSIPMGSGAGPWSGYGWAAYHYNYSAVVSSNGQNTTYSTASMCASIPPDYDYALYAYSKSPPPGSPAWTADGDYFYYGGSPGSCTPTGCGGACGWVSNGCGSQIWCGTCPCQPTTCAAAGADCGSMPDGCGHTLQCGTCGTGNTCVSNVCECTPKKCLPGWYWNYDDCLCEKPIHCKPGVCQ
jgi:hypothetical protein